MPIVQSDFDPPAYLVGAHRQTLLARFARRLPPLQGVSEATFELADGDCLEGVWSGPKGVPIALVLHGLAGSYRSPYIQGMLHALNQAGWRTLLMHFRGCGKKPNRLDRFYHGGDTGDMAEVVAQLQAQYEGPIVAVGFSLGANALLKWLGEMGSNTPLQAAAAISPPFDLDASVRLLESGSRLYEQWLLFGLKRQVNRKFKGRGMPEVLSHQGPIWTLRDFDHWITAPLHGFSGADDYYHRSSSVWFIPHIQCPTLMVQALDDPFVPESCMPKEVPDQVILSLSKTGGHVGFIESLSANAAAWHEKRIVDFLSIYHSGE